MMYNHDSLYVAPYEQGNFAAYKGEWTEEMLLFASNVAATGTITVNGVKALLECANHTPKHYKETKLPCYSVFADPEFKADIQRLAYLRGPEFWVTPRLRAKFKELADAPRFLIINGHGFAKALEVGDLPVLGTDLDSWLLVHFVYELSRYLRKTEEGEFSYRKGEIETFRTTNPALQRWFEHSQHALERGVWEIYENRVWRSRFDAAESVDSRDNSLLPDFGAIEEDFLDDPKGSAFQMGFDTDLFSVERVYRTLVRESRGRTPEDIIELAVRAGVRLFTFPIKVNKIINTLVGDNDLDANGLKDQILGYLKPSIWHFVQEGIKANNAFPKNPTLGQLSHYLNKVCAEESPSPTLRSAARNISNALEDSFTRDEAERRFADSLEKWRGVEPKSYYLKGAYALLLEDAYLGIQEEDVEVRGRETFLADKPLYVKGTTRYNELFVDILEELPDDETEDLSPEAFIREKLGNAADVYILPALKAVQDAAGDPYITPWEAFLPENGFGGVERPWSKTFRTTLSEEVYDEWLFTPGRPNDKLAEKRIDEINATIVAENARRAAIRKFLDSFDRDAFLKGLDNFNAQLRRDRAHLSDWEQPTFDTDDFAVFKDGDPCDF